MNELKRASEFNYIPEYKGKVDGWCNHKEFFDILISKIKPDIVVEVGSWKGLSSIEIAKSMIKYKRNATLYCVDTWLGAEEFYTHKANFSNRNLNQKFGYPSIYYEFLSNIINNKVAEYIIPFPTTSQIAANVFEFFSKKFDLIYIDADHTYNSVINDLTLYYKLLNDDGIIFGHDYTEDINNWLYPINMAINDFSKKENLKIKTYKDFWVLHNNDNRIETAW